MFLSVRHRVLFVHIAKTGGTSIKRALGRLRWTDPYSIPLYIVNHIGRATKYRIGCKFHRHARAIAAREMIGEPFFSELFKFCFVRNPWDLQVSHWLHVRRMPHAPLGPDVGFEAFIARKLDEDRAPMNELDVSGWPQEAHMVGLDGELLVDYVGRFERLEDDFNEVCGRARLPRLTLPHANRGGARRDYRSYYTDELAERVAVRYGRDIDRFGYTFDP